MTHELDPIRRFLDQHTPPTPCLIVDTDLVVARTLEFADLFPGARLRYAVKANPAPAVVDAVARAGAGFDVAGPVEIELCLARGAQPASLAYGNTIKKPADIEFAYARGVREFTSDAEDDLANLARYAPGSAVSVRLLLDTPASATPFGRKFGCEPPLALELVLRAAELGLRPGVGFHVGSQQPDTSAWDLGISAAAKVFAQAESHGIVPRRLNIGGGFATTHHEPVPSLAEYAAGIATSLRVHFPDRLPELMLEPGRAIIADAGVIRTEVVLVSRKSAADEHRWVYLDIGRYNGLAETENEAIAYRFEPLEDRGGPEGPVILAGPTCDGDDVLYQRTRYHMPLSLRAGDRFDIPGTGAYTASYASVGFNGIEPLRMYCIGRFVDAG